eukprot:CAMPEP_0197703368 /NCGR_PEP_ID=MMETSP1338-20131121/125403_1 /TAXON_ID=43686 ORGANISM="Pelagodinium beii, Strain RCC1491" /NCGR_SAMPLE_ID=MMETSP1338 /ASSEMBLY_ACC=CAM_ASM_000754 /LENGTH=107 /DNA_ID=CAMNT_0043287263 /DNA_START=67 /DNA_END=390 /DNA_ORIENTATION=-
MAGNMQELQVCVTKMSGEVVLAMQFPWASTVDTVRHEVQEALSWQSDFELQIVHCTDILSNRQTLNDLVLESPADGLDLTVVLSEPAWLRRAKGNCWVGNVCLGHAM